MNEALTCWQNMVCACVLLHAEKNKSAFMCAHDLHYEGNVVRLMFNPKIQNVASSEKLEPAVNQTIAQRAQSQRHALLKEEAASANKDEQSS